MFPFPPPVPVHLDSFLIGVSIVAPVFVLVTRFGFPAAKSIVLRFCLLVAVAVSVFVLAAVVTSISAKTWEHEVVPTGPVIGCFILAVGLITTSLVKFRGFYDRSLSRTILFAALVACGLAFLGPQTGSARPAILRARCREHLQSIGQAFYDRAKSAGRYPAAVEKSDGQPPQSWRVALLSEITRSGQVAYDISQPWDAGANLPAAQTEVEVYSCPAVGYPRDEQNRWLSPFALVTGPGTIFPDGRGLRIKDITDGTSSTILAVEAAGLRIVWSEPRDFDVSRDPIGVNLPGSALGQSPGLASSYHPGLANLLMADGRVMLVGSNIDPTILRKLTTAAGNETITMPLEY
jgi:prepilin-type processing-associated H-X9-DG protein